VKIKTYANIYNGLGKGAIVLGFASEDEAIRASVTSAENSRLLAEIGECDGRAIVACAVPLEVEVGDKR
jgi:hypothetical protein